MNAIYVRVSTEEQARSGYSIDAQIMNCIDKATSLALYDYQIYRDDGYSGEFIERPALDMLRQDLRNGLIKHIIMYDPDRMARVLDIQLQIAAEIEQAKANLIFCTHDYDASPEGKLFFMIRGAISQFEKAKIRERTMGGKKAKAHQGKLTFNDKLFGYDYDKDNSMYIINEQEAEIVRLIFQTYIHKQIGVRKLSLELRSLGIVNKAGKPFTPTHIHRMLCNESYAGLKWSMMHYDKKISQYKKKRILRDKSEWIPIEVPAIVSREVFNEAQKVMKNNAIISKRNTKSEYLLRSILKCGICGYSMIAKTRRQKGHDYKYYYCSSKDFKIRECHNKLIRADVLDEMVWDQLFDFAKRKIDSNKIIKNVEENIVTPNKLASYLTTLRKKQAALVRWAKDGILELDAAERELQSLSKEIAAAQQSLSELKQKNKPAMLTSPDEIIEAKTFEQRRAVTLKIATIFAKKTQDEIDWSF